MTPVFSQTFFLSAGETNAEQELSLPLLTSKIIDIATAHANSLGVGNPAMADRGCGWVLSRIAIEMERYPRVNETYTLLTWVESWNRHFSVRNFRVEDSAGHALGHATSVWMVLNTATRENAGLGHLHLDPSLIDGTRSPVGKMRRHLPISPYSETPEGEKPEGETPEGVRATGPDVEYTFRYTDLDFYRHVNTVRYVSMVLNRFTLEEMDATQVRRLEMSFMKESRYGEQVLLRRADRDMTSLFSLSDASDGAIHLFAAVTRSERHPEWHSGRLPEHPES